ncbi:CDP-glycerol glycerophosphotransferase family protein [Nocardioides flavescens]|uniref:CDP-glycerol--glycerophosphate glycerophosphotransferase n=1 Tax=Nocardioides flavescens TaxID=2691959 RepID=A0A6L7EXL7_9ACTN|nr:CDP-glycerol--glycerophosphate glycerophosphotransferase [Nocardioides flavescens]
MTDQTDPVGVAVEVVAYYPDDPTRVYQLLQWLPVLELLDTVHKVAVVTRDPRTAAVARRRTRLPVLLAPEFAELAELYDALAPKVALYVNNSMLNFHSLLDSRFLHVHIGHGESDKQSMASNNAKAYDRVLVAGEAAVQRHVTGLLEYDGSRLVRVGRPQLDLDRAPIVAESPRRTVLYAPTWEGDADYNDYTSVDLFADQIAGSVLALPDVRLVYKPHPKVVTSPTPAIRAGHQAVLDRLAEADRLDPGAGHVAVLDGDILAVMGRCDAMVTDVSSVGLDWLFLRTDKPIVLTDRHGDAERLRSEVPVSRCADVVDADSMDTLTALLAARLDHDEHHLARVAMRRHYFDDLAPGESTERFLTTVSGLVVRRDQLAGVPHRGSAETA